MAWSQNASSSALANVEAAQLVSRTPACLKAVAATCRAHRILPKSFG
jgi:hypothetical protein